MIRLFFALFLSVFALLSTYGQGFQSVVFTHKTRQTEQIFEKGQRLKVVAVNDLGMTLRFRGTLDRLTQDSLYLTTDDGIARLPLAKVTNIQRAGKPGWGWLLLVAGAVLLLGGGVIMLYKSGLNAVIYQPLGAEVKNPLGEILLGAGIALVLGGLLSQHPSVRYPKEQWEIQTGMNIKKTP